MVFGEVVCELGGSCTRMGSLAYNGTKLWRERLVRGILGALFTIGFSYQLFPEEINALTSHPYPFIP